MPTFSAANLYQLSLFWLLRLGGKAGLCRERPSSGTGKTYRGLLVNIIFLFAAAAVVIRMFPPPCNTKKINLGVSTVALESALLDCWSPEPSAQASRFEVGGAHE